MTTKTNKVILAALVSVLLGACGKQSSSSSAGSATNLSLTPTSPGGYTQPTGDNTSPLTLYSSTGSSDVTSALNNFNNWGHVLDENTGYTVQMPINSASNFKVTMDFAQVENGRYSGSVTISWIDSGVVRRAVLSAGSGRNQSFCCYSKDDNMLEAEYNHWATLSGTTFFSAFFQDNVGSIVVVIDRTVADADATGNATMSGMIYYKNFAYSVSPQSDLRRCWYIYSGAFNCRSTSVINKTGIYPTDGYTLMGTFKGLKKSAVFK